MEDVLRATENPAGWMHGATLTTLAALWLALTAASLLRLAWLLSKARGSRMTRWAWLLVGLYTGPFALALYWRHGSSVHSRKAIDSTVHCLAGDATGIVLAAGVTRGLHLPIALAAIVEYAAGFAVGLCVFESLFMRSAGDGYLAALRRSWLVTWISMNAVMAGMIPVMVILMSFDDRAMDPASPCFWGVMSMGTIAGALLALPINFWRSARRTHASTVAAVTLVMLAAGATTAVALGGLMPMAHGQADPNVPAPRRNGSEPFQRFGQHPVAGSMLVFAAAEGAARALHEPKPCGLGSPL